MNDWRKEGQPYFRYDHRPVWIGPPAPPTGKWVQGYYNSATRQWREEPIERELAH